MIYRYNGHDYELAACPMCRLDGQQNIELMVVESPDDLNSETMEGLPAITCGVCNIVMPGVNVRQVVKDWNEGTGL